MLPAHLATTVEKTKTEEPFIKGLLATELLFGDTRRHFRQLFDPFRKQGPSRNRHSSNVNKEREIIQILEDERKQRIPGKNDW